MSTKRKPATQTPSRGEILKYLGQRNQPLTEAALFRAFALRQAKDKKALRVLLDQLERDGVLIKNRKGRYALPSHMDMIQGRVSGHPDGYGFLIPDHGGPDLYLSSREMRNVLHGDRVVVRVARVDRRGRLEGTIVAVTERVNNQVVGRYVVENEIGLLIPDDQRISQDILIPPDQSGAAKSHEIVVAEIVRQPNAKIQPVGRIIEVLGEHMAPGMEIEIAMRKYDLPHRWSDAVSTELGRLEDEITADLTRRVDLRDLPLVTIDGEDARDFDDAVYCDKTHNGWRLVVAIADVSHYVAPGSALDHDAGQRGNSVYFPERVIPMLPEKLSNDLCSLKPDVDRLCFACEVYVDVQGNLGEYRFFEAIMRSKARLTYTEVAAILVDKMPAVINKYRNLIGALEELYALSQTLRGRRMRDGTIDLDLPETKIVFDEQRKIERIEPLERNDAHKLIEDCMLAANVCAADMLLTHSAPGLYRVHDKPDPLKIEDIKKFLTEFSLTLGGGGHPRPGDYHAVVVQCAGAPHNHIVQTALLRSLKQATYSTQNSGHFALGFDRYTHFTSPIRRYPDLWVHRVLKQLLDGAVFDGPDEDSDWELERIADHCSVTERRADEATRDVVQWLKAEYMLDRIGEQFSGVISAVTDFGIFVELSQVFVEGLVHVTGLGNDYFRFDPARHRLTGERSGVTYSLGDPVEVTVVRVDLDSAKIDFELADQTAGRKKRRRRRR
jgi:ribonuclease R